MIIALGISSGAELISIGYKPMLIVVICLSWKSDFWYHFIKNLQFATQEHISALKI